MSNKTKLIISLPFIMLMACAEDEGMALPDEQEDAGEQTDAATLPEQDAGAEQPGDDASTDANNPATDSSIIADASEATVLQDAAPLCAENPWGESDKPALERCYTRKGYGCGGEIVANAEANATFTAHPTTGHCTFSCQWSDKSCTTDHPDSRCSAAYAAKLAALCAQIGGTCAPTDTTPYCASP